MTWQHGVRFGLMGFPLALVGLPLYVYLPSHYATTTSLSLAAVGTILLASRLLDAVSDPWLGTRIGHWLQRPRRAAWASAAAALCLATGAVAAWHPPAQMPAAWLFGALVLAYLGLSLLTLWHGALGVRLGQTPAERATVAAWREGMGLMGVMAASAVLATGSVTLLGWLLLATLVPAWWALRGVARQTVAAAPPAGAGASDTAGAWATLLRLAGNRPFVRLWQSYLLNALAAAVAATVLPFYAADYLQAGSLLGGLLALYFVCAALSLPLWLRRVRAVGLIRAWRDGMVLALLAFSVVTLLPPGQAAATGVFLLVCALTGCAAGADLACAPALLAGICQRWPHAVAEGPALGCWTFATKASLALAAGTTLPLLQLLGYQPGAATPAGGVSALPWVYAGLPIVCKCLALCLLLRHRSEIQPSPTGTCNEAPANP